MTGPSASLTRRLGLLIPLLASNHEGEVVATVRAISTALAAEGFDLHDLAATVSGNLSKLQPAAASIAPPTSFDSMTHFEKRAWLDALLTVDWTTPYERGRIADVLNRVRTGLDYYFTPKTRRMIDALIARAEAKGVRP